MSYDRDDFNRLAICAMRYALGRSTYVVSEIVDLLIRRKKYLTKNTKDLMLRDINVAIERNECGMNMDKFEWEKLAKALGDSSD